MYILSCYYKYILVGLVGFVYLVCLCLYEYMYTLRYIDKYLYFVRTGVASLYKQWALFMFSDE